MSAADAQDARSRAFSVDFSHGAVLAGTDAVERVVLKHVMEPDGSVAVLFSEGGEVRRRPLEDVLAEQAAHFRMTCEWIAPDRTSELWNWVDKGKRELARKRECHVIDVLYGRTGPSDGSVDPRYDPELTTRAERRRAKRAELGISDPSWVVG